jgi:hypothetical protein
VRRSLAHHEGMGKVFLPSSVNRHVSRSTGPAIPDALTPAYFTALQRLHGLAYALADQPWDSLLSRAIGAALVVAKGHAQLAEAILEFGEPPAAAANSVPLG